MPHLFAKPKQVEISGPKASPVQTVSSEDAIREVRAIYGLDNPDNERSEDEQGEGV